MHTVASQCTGMAEEILDVRIKDTVGLLPSLHKGLASRVAGCTGFTERRQADRPASANTILKMSLETEKVSQPRQFPALTHAFFPPHIISAELSMQVDEVNQQLDISKVFTVRSSQVHYVPDYARYTCTVSVFWCESMPKPQKITWIASAWLLSDLKVHDVWYAQRNTWAAALASCDFHHV